MKDLIILGTGVHAAEMAEIVARINRVSPAWNLLGFIGAHEEADHSRADAAGLPVLGAPEAVGAYPRAYLVPDNEWPRTLPVPRDRLVSIVDPAAFVSETAAIGLGCVFYPNCFIGLNARVGDYVFSLSGSVINHDDIVEDRTVLASGVTLAGSVHVEPDCYLGQGCVIREAVRVGRNSLIGMAAVVVRDVPPNSVMAGNPARRLRDRHEGDTRYRAGA